MLAYRILADLIVMIHFCFVAFVVVGLLAIVVGLRRERAWARNPWLRVLHLLAILLVASQAILGIPCPLTVLENQFRRLGGQATYPGAFLGYWAHRLIFFEAPAWVFTLGYTLFGAVVLALFLLAPPRLHRIRPDASRALSRSEHENHFVRHDGTGQCRIPD